jgi:hypothetical protein
MTLRRLGVDTSGSGGLQPSFLLGSVLMVIAS